MPEPRIPGPAVSVGPAGMLAALELMARTADDAITATDPAGTVLIWNAAAERLFGIPASLAIGRTFSDLTESTVVGESDDRAPRQIAFARGSWRGRRIERARIGPDAGQEMIVEAALSRLEADDGTVIGVMGVRRDVTASVRMEQEFAALGRLATSTGVARTRDEMADEAIGLLCSATGADFGLITRHVGDAVAVDASRGLDPSLKFAIQERAVAESPLAHAVRAPGTVLMGLLEETPMRPESRAALARSGIASLATVGMHHKDELIGTIVLGWPAATLPRASRAVMLQAAAHVEHALENLRLVEHLSASERRYRTLFDESPEALLLVASTGEIVEANAAAHRLFRADRSGLVGQSTAAVTGAGPDDLRAAHAVDGGDGRTLLRTAAISADGETLAVELQIAPVEIDGASRLMLLVRDVTAEAELQAELIQAQKMDAIGQLVSGVAHELNNPLAAIIAFSQLIRRDPNLPEEMRRDADVLNQEADRTRKIVGNLLDFARQRPPERHPTRLGALVRTVLDLQAYNLASGRIEVAVDIPPSLPSVPVDRSQVQQVLLNLTRNAMQAIASVADHGTITITARTFDGGPRDGAPLPMIRLSVSDDGPGVEESHRDRLFMPFFSTKPPGEGTGLGLPVSFGIIAAHGGQLRFEPGPGGKGASFVVELPVIGSVVSSAAAGPAGNDVDPWFTSDDQTAKRERPPDAAAPAPVDVVAAPPPMIARVSGGRRVLVLDDEASIRRLLTKILIAAGYRPVTAAGGAEAIAAVQAGDIDAVVCDHRMAGMSGIEVYRAVIELQPALADRFIFMSGDVLNHELRSFAREHRVRLLAKPFDVEAVVAAIHELVGEIALG